MTKVTFNRSSSLPLSAEPSRQAEFSALLKTASKKTATEVAKTRRVAAHTPSFATRQAILLEDLLHKDKTGKQSKDAGLSSLGELAQRANEKANAVGDTAVEIVLVRGEGPAMAQFEHAQVGSLIFVSEAKFADWETGRTPQFYTQILEPYLTDYISAA